MQHRNTVVLFTAMVLSPAAVLAQDSLASNDVDPPPQTAPATSENEGRLPFFVTGGVGYGQRYDGCAQCTSAENLQSFTGHVSIGKYVWRGLAVGLDGSLWKRAHPGVPDTLGGGSTTSLVNQLGNASLSFSYQTWHVFVRAGVGLALGYQDIQSSSGSVTRASGKGIGYSFGGGVTLPIASLISLAFFANWNAGSYDLSTAEALIERGVKHKYIEVGFGLTLR